MNKRVVYAICKLLGRVAMATSITMKCYDALMKCKSPLKVIMSCRESSGRDECLVTVEYGVRLPTLEERRPCGGTMATRRDDVMPTPLRDDKLQGYCMAAKKDDSKPTQPRDDKGMMCTK